MSDSAPFPDAATVVLSAPKRGFASVTVAIEDPGDRERAETLDGPNGILAQRIATVDNFGIYNVEGFWEIVDDSFLARPDGTKDCKVVLTERATDQAEPPFQIHPAVSDDLTEIIPVVADLQGEPLRLSRFMEIETTNGRKVFEAVWESTEIAVVAFYDVRPRNPVIEVSGFRYRKSGWSGVAFARMQFGEEVACRGGCVIEFGTTGAVRLESDTDTAAIAPFRFAILCDSQGITDEEGPDIWTQEAIEAGKLGPFYGRQMEKPTRFLGTPDLGEGRLRTDPFGAIEAARLRNAFADQRRRPHTSGDHPHAAGNQDGFGVTYLPAWSGDDPRDIRAILWNAEDWMSRPTFYFEPGETPGHPVSTMDRPGFWTKTRAPYEGRHPGTDHHQQIGRDKLPGRSEIEDRKGHDDQHFADMPLIAGFVLTGDPLLRRTIQLLAAMDLAQIQTKIGTSGNGRAEGRVGINMMATALALGEEAQDLIEAHLEQRLMAAKRTQETLDGPLGLAHNRSACALPAITPYEEAQAAYACLFIAEHAESPTLRRLATEVGTKAAVAMARCLYRDAEKVRVPYRVSRDIPESAKLGDASPYVHPGDWRWWSAQGAHAYLSFLGEGGHYGPICRDLLKDLSKQEISRVSDLNLGRPFAPRP